MEAKTKLFFDVTNCAPASRCLSVTHMKLAIEAEAARQNKDMNDAGDVSSPIGSLQHQMMCGWYDRIFKSKTVEKFHALVNLFTT
jgi:hypothetical protein